MKDLQDLKQERSDLFGAYIKEGRSKVISEEVVVIDGCKTIKKLSKATADKSIQILVELLMKEKEILKIELENANEQAAIYKRQLESIGSGR